MSDRYGATGSQASCKESSAKSSATALIRRSRLQKHTLFLSPLLTRRSQDLAKGEDVVGSLNLRSQSHGRQHFRVIDDANPPGSEVAKGCTFWSPSW